MARVLVIDDEDAMAAALSGMMRQTGYEVDLACSLQAGIDKALSGAYDVILLDVHLPDGDGLRILPELIQTPSAPEVIIMTGYGDPDGAEIAIRSGAWDYLQKPISRSGLMLSLNRVFEYRKNLSKRSMVPVTLKLNGIIGGSPQMKACLDLVARAAANDVNVLITGETGTGKELTARAIHYNSPRSSHHLIVVDCAALPETLVESALFGHEKGAFTGADRTREGLVKEADGGTLFLDEIGDLSQPLQKTFLRVLQERRFRPIGGKQEMQSDFRLIAATNQNLDGMVEEGLFRSDLLYRIRSIIIDLPPLREHPEDIRDLVFYHVGRLCANYGMEAKGFSPDFLDVLAAYDWPGNIRELVGTLEQVLTLARDEPILFAKHLPHAIRAKAVMSSIKHSRENGPSVLSAEKCAAAASSNPFPPYKEYCRTIHEKAEKEYLQQLIALAKGSIKTACGISGLGRTTLYLLLKKHGISRLGW